MTIDLKDDFVQSKDDFYISCMQFLEDAENKDDIYRSDDCGKANTV